MLTEARVNTQRSSTEIRDSTKVNPCENVVFFINTQEVAFIADTRPSLFRSLFHQIC